MGAGDRDAIDPKQRDALLAAVYETSLEWARLGNSSMRTEFGEVVWNTDDRGHREGNAVWRFDPSDNLAQAMATVRAHFEAVGNRCHHWVPVLGDSGDALASQLPGLGFRDTPSAALVMRLSPAAPLPEPFEAIDARVAPDQLRAVYRLPGQRWRIESVLARALSVLAWDSYESYVCTWHGQLAGRVGLLHGAGRVARLKSVFVGSAFRRQGVGHALMRHVANRALALGNEWLASEVDLDNTASVDCHRSFGFSSVGTMHCWEATRGSDDDA